MSPRRGSDPVAPHEYTVTFGAQYGGVVHYRVSRGAKGGEAVSVRTSDRAMGRFTCLTCPAHQANDCAHVVAAMEFDRELHPSESPESPDTDDIAPAVAQEL